MAGISYDLGWDLDAEIASGFKSNPPVSDLKSQRFEIAAISVAISTQQTPKYHTKGCSRSSESRSSIDSPGARTLVFAAFQPFSSCEFRASIARTPFCAILWRSPIYATFQKI